MDRKEAILRIKDHMKHHGIGKYPHLKLKEALDMAIAALDAPNEWVSVEERLPGEKQRVIVRCERVGTSAGWILWGRWMTDVGPDAGKVTHWMPLPAPPDSRPPEGEEDT